MTKLNGNFPIVIIGSVIAVMATFIGLQQRRMESMDERIGTFEQGATVRTERIAIVETDVKYIRVAVDDIKAMLKD